METTFSIIKPNAMKKNALGAIIAKFEENGLRIAGAKLMHIPPQLCKEFYAEHNQRPFFGELVDFMTSAPVLVMALSGENAIAKNRKLMGATNPSEAEAGTIRAEFGDNVGENAIHGSDSPESATREISLFFTKDELFHT